MTNQGALIPGDGGLWARVLLPSGDIHGAAWRDAIERDQLVGTCRSCGSGYLRPLQQYRTGLTDWFPAECVSCGADVAHHGPQPAEKKTGGPR